MLKTILASVLTSGLIAAGVTTLMDKNSELETRTYELKYEIYSDLDEIIAELNDIIHFGTDTELIAETRNLEKKLPKLLLVTRNHNLVSRIINVRQDIIEPSDGEISGEDREVIRDKLVRISVLLADDFSDYVTTDEEIESFLGRELKANILQKTGSAKKQLPPNTNRSQK